MKKALIVTAVAGFIRGFLSDDIRILQEMGYEVHCAADAENVGADGLESHWRLLKVKFHQIHFNSKRPFSKETWVAYGEMRKLLKTEQYDVIHSHTPIAGCISRIAAQRYRKSGTKVLYTSHGFYFHKGSNKKTWMIFHSIENLMSFLSDAIITINYEDYECAKKMHCKDVFHINGVGLDLDRFMNVQVDRETFRASVGVMPDDIMLLAAGELSDRKNHQVIIKALAELQDNRIIFILCGRAMQGRGTYDLLMKLADDHNVRFKMLGFRKDMPMIYHCADIGVLPSTREGLGMVGLQALAAGVPLVTSNVHGIVDYMVEGKTGYMVSPYDVSGFADAIKKLADPGMRNRLRPNCLAMVQNFSKEVSKKQKKEIYEKVL